jgi:hypothetical protein
VAATQTLATKPDDAESNLTVGKYLCFRKGEWERGLPLLARSSASKLKELAKGDLANPSDVAEQVAVGNGWWSLAQKEPAGGGRQLHRRAGHWYVRALPLVSGVERARIEERFQTLALEFPGSLEYLDCSQGAIIEDFVRLKDQQRMATRWQCSGPFELTLVARTERGNIRLHANRGSLVVFGWRDNFRELRMKRPDSKNDVDGGSLVLGRFEPLQANTWYTLRWLLTGDTFAVSVNGKTVFVEKGTYDLSWKRRIELEAFDTTVDVKSFVVKPLK